MLIRKIKKLHETTVVFIPCTLSMGYTLWDFVRTGFADYSKCMCVYWQTERRAWGWALAVVKLPILFPQFCNLPLSIRQIPHHTFDVQGHISKPDTVICKLFQNAPKTALLDLLVTCNMDTDFLDELLYDLLWDIPFGTLSELFMSFVTFKYIICF